MAGRRRQRSTASDPDRTSKPVSITPTAAVPDSECESHYALLCSLALEVVQMAHSWHGDSGALATHLSHYVLARTHGQAQLVFRHESSLARTRQSTHSPASFEFPVFHGMQEYGVLNIAPSEWYPDVPTPPLIFGQFLAAICGLVLHHADQSSLLAAGDRSWGVSQVEPLTPRELEIVSLMCKGYSREKIAQTLSVASGTLSKHLQHIYAKFAVHNERDAAVAAYSQGAVSLIGLTEP